MSSPLQKQAGRSQVLTLPHAPFRLAKRKAKKANIQANLFTDDATRMKNVTGQFDLALDLGCFHSLENKADYLTQLDRILAPNGFWLMYGFLAPASKPTAPGIANSDLNMISAQAFTLLTRRNGFDKRETSLCMVSLPESNE